MIISLGLCSNTPGFSNVNNKNNKSGLNNTSTQYYGNVAINTWADGKKSAYSFSFDDGFISQYQYTRPILDQFGFHGTFYVIAGSLTDTLTAIWRYGFWWQFREMAAEGHEIGAHTMTHPYLTTQPVGDTTTPNTVKYEIYQSKKIIQEKIPFQKCLTFAYPYCAENDTVESVVAKYFVSARGCSTFADGPDITGNNWYNLSSTDIRFNQPRNSPADDLDELTNYENRVQSESIDLGKWTVLMGHEMVPFALLDSVSNGYYPMTTEWFTALCEWIKQKSDDGDVWVATVRDVSRYIKERQNFYSNLISQTESKIEIEPLDGLDTTIYNYPLTADITVPDSWDTVTVSQGNTTFITRTFTQNSATVIRTKIVPGGGIVSITPGASSGYILAGNITYNNIANTPLKDVVITLDGPGGVSNAVSDSNGYYKFNNLVPGTYTIALTKTDGWGGVNSIDALMIQKYENHRAALDSLQISAADVNNDGIINNLDIEMIKERYLGKIQTFPKPDWLFPENLTVQISTSNITENIKGIATGDVNESFKP